MGVSQRRDSAEFNANHTPHPAAMAGDQLSGSVDFAEFRRR